MQKKEFEHEKIETCRTCKKEIDTTSEKYSVMLDLDGDNIYSIGFYHTECLKDVITGKGKMIEEGWKRQLKPLINRANEIVSKVIPTQATYNVN